ncbi:MAG: ribose 5-phosphate isomerase B [Nitrospirae bacterium]|nr:ribose 5-phosphate isomerase B [Nitrospirota bacterium]
MVSDRPIAIASDHGGLDLKNQVVRLLQDDLGLKVDDMGAFSDESVDYPDYGMLVARAVSTGQADRGILICGTGIGMSIIANKFAGVRAALCHNADTARLSREHNDANILVLGGRVLSGELAREMVRIWFNTPFEGGRHKRRIDKIRELEEHC